LDFLGNDYSGLVKYKLGDIQGMETFSGNYTSDQQWAYPDLDHVYTLMEQKVK